RAGAAGAGQLLRQAGDATVPRPPRTHGAPPGGVARPVAGGQRHRLRPRVAEQPQKARSAVTARPTAPPRAAPAGEDPSPRPAGTAAADRVPGWVRRAAERADRPVVVAAVAGTAYLVFVALRLAVVGEGDVTSFI